MNNYQQFTRELHSHTQEGTVYLSPNQIQITSQSKTTEQNRNAVIRLATSIKKYGVLEPIEARHAGVEQGREVYELITGERRLKAAILAGIDRIPCRILPESDRKCRISAILAQLRCESLHYFEQAAAFRMLTADFALTQEEIARKSGFSQSAIANKMRLLSLSKEEQLQIANAGLTERHARAVLRLKTHDLRQEALAKIKAARLNVADTECLVDQLLSKAAILPSKPEGSREIPMTPLRTPPNGQIPRKFALQDLTPLYNSIERTLSIFRKTGAEATCTKEERRDAVRIIIDIPSKA